jgi:formate C-acetyltransferase
MGHTLPDHGIILGHGIAGLRSRIAERRTRDCGPGQGDQLLAMDRCLEGLQKLCLNCAREARERARRVEDAQLELRLHGAARDCETLAEAPPRTFAQALQLLTLSHFADTVDSPGDACSFGRIDRLLWPFYDADRAAGRLTRETAFDWLCEFVVKCWRVQSSESMTVGGVDETGQDATNDLSFLLLEAMEALGLTVNLNVRWHRALPPAFVETVARVVRRGLGRPSMCNDDVTIPGLVAAGIEPEDARDYAPLGCVEVMIPGRSAYRTMGMGLNLPKILELVLHEGRCQVTGDEVWNDVPATFDSFEALHAEYRRRVRDVVRLGCEIAREDERKECRVFPRPYLTVLSRGGVEDAVDITAGQPRYDPVGVTLSGVADIVNALTAVRKLVFEDRRCDLDELRDILSRDWKGAEPLRQFVLNRVPRFGQDNPTVNALAGEETGFFADCFENEKTAYGGPFLPMIFGVSTDMLSFTSPRTGALPSGRRRGDTLAFSLQPCPNGRRGGITTVLGAVNSLDHRRFPGGISNVQECDPAIVQGEEGLQRLVALLRGFFEGGGQELSLNFLDAATLRDAQRDPNAYEHLMVRLFGLSARFVNLSPEMQEMMIRRAESAAGHAAGDVAPAGRGTTDP